MRQTIKHATLRPDVQAERDSFRENNDCTVVALVAAAELSYSEAHAMLTGAGRRPRKGFKFRLWLNNQCTMAKYKNTRVQIGRYYITRVPMPEGYTMCGQKIRSITLTRFLEDFPKGRFIVRKRSHVFTVLDGQVMNLFTGARTRITDIWHLKEATQ